MLVKVDVKWSKLFPYSETSLSFNGSENPGVYSISASLDQKMQVVYVGKADKIGQRLRNHKRFFEPNSFLRNMLEERECYFRYCEVPDALDRQNIEYTLFRYYHPVCNIVEPKGEIIDVNID